MIAISPILFIVGMARVGDLALAAITITHKVYLITPSALCKLRHQTSTTSYCMHLPTRPRTTQWN